MLLNDPATSLNGRMAKAMLSGSGFETVKVESIYSAAASLAKSDADYVITVLPEEIPLTTMTLVGPVPPALGLKIDFGGGVPTRAGNPQLAEQFLAYLVSPEAALVWKAGGVTARRCLESPQMLKK